MAADPLRQTAVRERLIEALRADLVGPMATDEVIPSRPSRWYLAGFLVPNDTPMVERQDPEVGEALSIDADRGDEAEDDVAAHTAYLPSSMGLSFFVGPDTDAVEVTAEWADYAWISQEETRRYLELERQRRRAKAATRRGAAASPLLEAEEPGSDEADEASPDGGGERTRYRYWRRGQVHAPTLRVSLRPPYRPVPLTDDRRVFLSVSVRPAPASEGAPGTRVVSLFLVNGREPQHEGADERFLFQTRLVVRCAEGFHPRRQRDPSTHRDDRRNDLQFRDQPVWAVGHGVATEVPEGARRAATEVATTWIPLAKVPRVKALDLSGVSTNMEALAALPDASALGGGLLPLLEAYTTWIAAQAQVGRQLDDPRHRETALVLVAEAELAEARIRAGIERLLTDALAWKAFQLTNRAMAATARRQRPGEEPHWRLFQLAFLLLNIVGTSDPNHDDRERVDLLFFPTGGGKTEAYLGVAAFALFSRRLRGQGSAQGGLGVGVLLRYTLRLLTLDQLKRAAQLACAMELERRADPLHLGRARFTVGIWVGRSATANRLTDLAPVIRKIREGLPLFGEPAPLPLEACPWCGTKLGQGAYALLPSAKRPHTLLVSCADEDCPFHAEQGEDLPPHRRGLPVVAIDDHVYSELPSILIGTVDKFASLPWRGASGNLFGRVRAVGAIGAPDEGVFYGNNEKPPSAATPLPTGLLPPDLIIQDELHLISGPLGTMVGLYETAIDALCRDKVPRGPKILASTATARRASEQIQAIFARSRVHLFPAQGINDGDTFFAETDARPEKSRYYLGVAAPGRAVKLLASRVYTALLGATQRQWLAEGAPGAGNAADTYMSLVAYFNALRELGGAQRILQEEVSGRARRLSERRPLGEEESRHFADRWLSYDLLELTSRQTTDQIKSQAARMARPYELKGPARTDVLLASSMISVGVDIPRLGLMVVNGQPRTVAEYIQASSRVGRESPGLVVTAFSLYKPRDRSHYESFDSFHQSFYRSVEAASVTPFSARAIDRGLAGLVVSLARHLPPRMAAPERVLAIDTAADLPTLVKGLLLARAAAHRDGASARLTERLARRVDFLLGHWRELVLAVNEAGGSLRYSPWEGQTSGETLLHTAVDDISAGDYTEHLAEFRAPTSMRDVEPSVHIWVDKQQSKGAK
jgi:hypothetical protein